jgi:anaerobic C4-dicarboxylate transporter
MMTCLGGDGKIFSSVVPAIAAGTGTTGKAPRSWERDSVSAASQTIAIIANPVTAPTVPQAALLSRDFIGHFPALSRCSMSGR